MRKVLESQRAHRIGEQIHQEVSSLLVKGLKDPRIGFVTITYVEVTSDLHLARIYYTVMGDTESRKNTVKGLKSSIPFIRKELGRRIRTRYIPELLFQYDTSLEYGNRIENLIREISSTADDSSNSEED